MGKLDPAAMDGTVLVGMMGSTVVVVTVDAHVVVLGTPVVQRMAVRTVGLEKNYYVDLESLVFPCLLRSCYYYLLDYYYSCFFCVG